MIQVILTIIIVGAFFILFFNPTYYDLKNKTDSNKKISTSHGFVKDVSSDPFLDNFIPPTYGDIGTFNAFSSIPDDNWMSGFPTD